MVACVFQAVNVIVTLCLLANIFLDSKTRGKSCLSCVFGLRILATSLLFHSHGRVVGVSEKTDRKKEKTFKAFRRDLMFYGFMQIEHECSRTGEAVFFFF